MKIIIRCLGSLGLLLVMTVAGWANQISWSETTSVWSNHNATAALYSANPNQEGLSWLVQLIWAGPNGVADPVTNTTTTGVSGDDVTVAYKWVGFGVPLAQRLGHFNVSGVNAYNNTYADGQNLFIRAWEQPDNLSGAPTNTAAGQWYGNSVLHAITDFGTGNPEIFDAGTTQPLWFQITAIPEPGACAFFATGLLIMFFHRMIQRWRN